MRPLLCLLLLACALPAQAQLFKDDEARQWIIELRTRVQGIAEARSAQQAEIKATQEQLVAQLAQLRGALGEISQQIEALRAEQAQLLPVREARRKEIAALVADQARFVATLEPRLKAIEPRTVQIDGASFEVLPEEERLYSAAMAKFKANDFFGAAFDYDALLTRYAGTGYSASALFWLGNALYGVGDFRESMRVLRSFIAAHPNHPRVPAAWLAVANCQIELKDPRAARKTLDDLIKAHAGSEAAATARERLPLIR
jgi:tol-pal system protein YbgF